MRPRSAVFPLLGLLLTGCAGVGGHVRPGATEAAIACASPAPTPATSPSSGPTLAPNAPVFNFDDPWGVDPTTFDQAAQVAQFPLYQLESLGSPSGVYVWQNGVAVATTYGSDCGRVILIQSELDLDPANWESSIRSQVANYPKESAGEVKIARLGDADAIVYVGANYHSVSVEWLQGDTEFNLLTPDAIENQAVDLSQDVYDDVVSASPMPTAIPSG